MKKQAVVISPQDNVATVVDDFASGTLIHFFIGGSEQSLQLLQDIPLGHKFAICDISPSANILKYAESIGISTTLILAGQHVHVHNMESQRGRSNK
ncbi:D-galactarate dehydratase [Desulfosporosinus fructosivorans]|uniref:D-galactarate dehydratase n=1 Tax=Desulfosporosinus fructosivorans TaxID=2018669 RepID=A0A4Z0R304_9FIRM|nr:UxaA family hydrolase [Desulfosporosinus fructosivorans]TGE36367.1 D-galactarate dehydratase [Desulfosporosinus fructosivorans]